MENEPLLILYTREGCHLCEQVVQMLEEAGLAWRPIDIDSDSSLLEMYGLRVPVVQHPASRSELFYPFDPEQLRRFAEGQ